MILLKIQQLWKLNWLWFEPPPPIRIFVAVPARAPSTSPCFGTLHRQTWSPQQIIFNTIHFQAYNKILRNLHKTIITIITDLQTQTRTEIYAELIIWEKCVVSWIICIIFHTQTIQGRPRCTPTGHPVAIQGTGPSLRCVVSHQMRWQIANEKRHEPSSFDGRVWQTTVHGKFAHAY